MSSTASAIQCTCTTAVYSELCQVSQNLGESQSMTAGPPIGILMLPRTVKRYLVAVL